MLLRNLRHAALGLVLAFPVLALDALGEAPPPPSEPEESPALNALEEAFVEQMKDCTLVGHFTTDGAAPGNSTDADRYRINGVSKVKGNDWVVNARIVYGDLDVVVPVPVKMHWAGDTPVLSVTDLTIPLLGEDFSARLLFDGDRYAGTWGHGEVGGHMWGRIEKNGATGDAEAPPEP